MNFKSFENEYLRLSEIIDSFKKDSEEDEEVTDVFGYCIDSLIHDFLGGMDIDDNEYTFGVMVSCLIDCKTASECYEELQK